MERKGIEIGRNRPTAIIFLREGRNSVYLRKICCHCNNCFRNEEGNNDIVVGKGDFFMDIGRNSEGEIRQIILVSRKIGKLEGESEIVSPNP